MFASDPVQEDAYPGPQILGQRVLAIRKRRGQLRVRRFRWRQPTGGIGQAHLLHQFVVLDGELVTNLAVLLFDLRLADGHGVSRRVAGGETEQRYRKEGRGDPKSPRPVLRDCRQGEATSNVCDAWDRWLYGSVLRIVTVWVPGPRSFGTAAVHR